MSTFSQRIRSLSPEKKELLARQLKKKGTAFNSFPLSFAQQRLWLLDQLEPGNPSYNVATSLRFRGHLHVAALQASFEAIVRRHETLRTTFATVQGQPVQVIASSLKLSFPIIDLRGLNEQERATEMQLQADGDAQYSFHLANGPLFRIHVFRLSDQEHIVLLNLHHIISDGWSITVLQRELATFYTAALNGRPSPLPPLPIQYADYAAWQRKWLQGDVLEQQVSYWRRQLLGAPALLDLPADRPRPATQTYRGGMETLALPAPLAARLRDLGRKKGVTLFMTLLALFQILLHRYTGQEDLVVGTPIANRNRAEIEGLIGFFVNSLVLRTDLSGEPSFHELLWRIREVTLEAYAHQDLPFDKLVEELSPERNLSHTPLFQVFFNMVNIPEQAAVWPEQLSVELSAPGEAGAKFDLTLYATDRGADILLELLYNKDLFDQPRMLEMLHQFAHLASQIHTGEEKISALSLVTTTAQRCLPDPTAPLSERWEGSVQELFARQAGRNPGRVAVVDTTEQVNYQELNLLSNRLAHYLRARGVVQGDVIAVYGHRSATLVWAILGILKAGAAFLILDPAYPAARLLEYLRMGDARGLLHIQAAGALSAEVAAFFATPACRCLLELPRSAADLNNRLAAWPSDSPAVVVGPDDLACITFTSGSTGRPKGVLQRHGPLTHFLPWQQQRFDLLEAERYSLLSGLSHDPLQREIFTPLCLGGTICIPPPEQMGTPGWLARWMCQNEVHIAHLTPAMLQILTQAATTASGTGVEMPSLRRAFVVGDTLARHDVSRLYLLAPSLICINTYGTTETQRAVGYFVIPRTEISTSPGAPGERRSKEVIPLGRGSQDVQLLILNAARKLAGVGELGEIYIRSPHLARGYLNDTQLTEERFLLNPFTEKAGDRLYRTRDLGRYMPDGNVEFAGRADEQIKLRGFRIEPAEIEAALKLHPAVRETAVIAREDTPGEKRLVAYIVLAQAQPLPVEELRAFLATRLPGHMVPSAFVFLEALPLLANHKLDRRALPIPESVSSVAESANAARTPMEEILAGIWAKTLNVERVGREENFFALGGHSLTATQLMARIHETLRQEVPLRALFEAPTVAGLASYLEQQRSSDIASRIQAIVPLPRAYSRVDGQDGQSDAPISSPSDKIPRDASLFPASFAQERLWFLDQLEPGSAAYTIVTQFHIQGNLRLKALQQSVQSLVQRHEILRTTLVEVDGRLMQVVASSLNVSPNVVDLSELRGVEQQSQIQRCEQNEARRFFDLMRGPLFSLTLLRLGAEEHILLFSIHHSISDDWSLGIFFQELDMLYTAFCAGKQPHLKQLPLHYADYAAWQREWLQGETLAQLLAYWKGHLQGAPALLELPTDHPRPQRQTFRGARYSFALPASLSHSLQALSHQHNVTLYMTLLAAFQLLLARASGQHDLVIGTPIAGRQRLALEDLIGLFVNTLALRADLAGNPTVRDLLARVRESTLAAYAHQDLPFEKLVEELAPERHLGYSPLFQVMFILQNTPAQPPRLADLVVTQVPMQWVAAKFDLTLVMWQEDGSLRGYVEYNADLFEAATIQRLAGHWHILLEGMAANPAQRLSQVPLLTPAEHQVILVDWNATEAAYPLEQSLPQLFEQQVQRTPDAIAAVFDGHALTYRELNRRANQLARTLQMSGVNAETLVGLCVERSLDMLVGLLGILKAGAAYVPLDPTYPRARLAFMLEDSRAQVVLTQRHLRETLPALRARIVLLDAQRAGHTDESEAYSSRPGTGEELAYVIYTSGSTGQPKGVLGTHRATLNRLRWMWQRFPFTEGDICCQKTSLSFVDSVWEIFGPLLRGVYMVIISDAIVKDAYRLVSTLAEQGVTRIVLVPSLLYALLDTLADAGADLSHVNYWSSSGEALATELAERFPHRLPHSTLINLYGSSEVAADATYAVVTAGQDSASVPIGRPVANTRIYLLDAQGQPVPIGVPGEIFIGGANLARGYLNRPELTAERFVPDSFSKEAGARLYKTGDLARYLPDGNLEYLGRSDRQAKIRGYRIELQEIEAALARHPAVHQSVVTVRNEPSGDKRLVAYIVPHQGEQALSAAQLRAFLKERLPEYMLPSSVMRLSALPLLPNGKVDQRSLPAPEPEAAETGETETEARPYTPVEEVVAGIWADVLGLEHVNVFDNFFEIGGHSLLATRIVSRVRSLFQADLSVIDLFEEPTVAGLAGMLLKQEAVPGQITAIANVRLKLKQMSASEVHAQLKQIKKARGT